MKKGYIYIMTNPGLKNMVKIGYATDVEARRQQLSTTNLPYEYEVYATYETSGKLEDRKLHFLIDKLNPELRIARNREFYEMAPEDAFQLLEAIATISGTQDKLIRVKPLPATHGHNAKKPAVDFFKCGIPVGARLVYIDDPSVIATVVSERRVEYEGQLTSLSAIAKEIKGYPVAGPSFFTYNGKLVAEIARETQWKDI
jgi:hypothetical protein